MSSFDVLIRNVRIIDGTAEPLFKADVGIRGNEVAEIGNLARGTAIESIDGRDGYLAPGFIDTHTHDDVAILNDRVHPAKLLQGVTTVVVGNCGFSNYPVDLQDQTRLHLESLVGSVERSQVYPDFKSYRASADSDGLGLNLISMVGHGPLRLRVMGYDKREATPNELAQMCELLERQLEQGAFGLSLGLAYPPSAFAAKEELVCLASVLKKHDRLVAAHIRSYEGALLDAIDEFLEILRLSGAKGLLSHLQIAGRPYWGKMREALDKIERARSSGLDIVVDMYPYPAGSTTILQLLPPSVQEGGIKALVARLAADGDRERIGQLVESGKEPGWESKIALIGWENVRIGSANHHELKQFEGDSIAEAAKASGLTPIEFTFEVIRLDQGRTNIIMFQQSEEDLRMVHQSRLMMVGSDSIPRTGGKPHPRMYGTFPRVIGRLAMKERLMPLEEAVRRMTSLPAQRFQIRGRGLLRPGSIADFVLFNDDFLDRATFEDPQLYPAGLEGVWVNGIRVVQEGEVLYRKPGRVLIAQ
jgi:N-acyl-D-amino-acid deacylase